MHGATFVVDAAFFAEELDAHGLVVDIGLATEALGAVLAPLRYRNLDEVPEFVGRFTTTEFLCRHVFEQLAAARAGGAARRRRAAAPAAGDAAREPHRARRGTRRSSDVPAARTSRSPGGSRRRPAATATTGG